VFAVHLTETPVAAGAKGLGAPEVPLAPAGAVKVDFQTYLGQAQTAAPRLGAAVTPPIAKGLPGEAAAILPIERVSRAQAGVTAPVLPDAPEATHPVLPVSHEGADIAAPDIATAPDLTLSSAPDTPTQVLAEGQSPASDGEPMPTLSVPDQEAVPARTLSPDRETGSEVETPDLSPSDIPDAALPQPASGIPSDQNQDAAGMPGDTPVAPMSDPVELRADLADEIALPALDETATADQAEHIGEPATPDLTPQTEPSEQGMMGAGVAAGAQMDPRRPAEDIPARTAALPLSTEAGQSIQADLQPRLQTLDQPVGDAAFSRILTEVSVAAAPVAAPVQTVQPNAAPAQVQGQMPLDMSQPDWAEKLVEDVSLQPMGRGDTLTLTLTPERLGTMQVRLEMQDGQTHVHFITETPEAARLLTEAQSRLADLMSRAGVDLGSQSASTGQGSQQNDRSAQGRPMQDGASAAQQDATTDQREAPPRPGGPASRSTIDVVA
jgi:flagellar hook-length control protein FliK